MAHDLQGLCFWPAVNAQGRAQSTTPPTGRWPEAPRVSFPPTAPPQQAASKSPFRSHFRHIYAIVVKYYLRQQRLHLYRGAASGHALVGGNAYQHGLNRLC